MKRRAHARSCAHALSALLLGPTKPDDIEAKTAARQSSLEYRAARGQSTSRRRGERTWWFSSFFDARRNSHIQYTYTHARTRALLTYIPFVYARTSVVSRSASTHTVRQRLSGERVGKLQTEFKFTSSDEVAEPLVEESFFFLGVSTEYFRRSVPVIYCTRASRVESVPRFVLPGRLLYRRDSRAAGRFDERNVALQF